MMGLKASKLNNKHWKEWFNDNISIYIGSLTKGDVRLGISLGNKTGSVDLFVITFGYERDQEEFK